MNNLKTGSKKDLEAQTIDRCFESIKNAAAHYGCNVSTVSKRCNLELSGYEE